MAHAVAAIFSLLLSRARKKSPHGSTAWSHGFTLVELLAVVAIIGLLVALLLPALQTARESARRSTCGNNMRQISLAILSYASAMQTLPAVGDPRGTGAWPWTVAILPQLEQAAIADRLLAASPFGLNSPTLQPLVEAPMPLFLCPSCPAGLLDTAAAWSSAPGFRSSKLNYLANAGPQSAYAGGSCPTGRDGVAEFVKQSRGAIRKRRGLPPALIRDGFASTFLIGEAGGLALISGEQPWLPGLWATAIRDDNEVWTAARYGSSKINSGKLSFGSFHPGGANFSLCDGAVRFVSEFIEFNAGGLTSSFLYCIHDTDAAVNAMRASTLGVYQSLSTRDDGRMISSESF